MAEDAYDCMLLDPVDSDDHFSAITMACTR